MPFNDYGVRSISEELRPIAMNRNKTLMACISVEIKCQENRGQQLRKKEWSNGRTIRKFT